MSASFVVQDIEFRGSGESDDPNRVVDLLPLQVAKQLGESDDPSDLIDRSSAHFIVTYHDEENGTSYMRREKTGLIVWVDKFKYATRFNYSDAAELLQDQRTKHYDRPECFQVVPEIKSVRESDEVDDVLSRMDTAPEQFVVAANIKGYGQSVFYLQNDCTWSYDFGAKHQGRSSNIRNFATQEEADIWINRYKRRQSRKAPGYVTKAWTIPLGSKVKLGDEVTDLLDRTSEPDYVFQFDGDAEDGEPGPFYFAQHDRTGDEFYGTWVREINDATLYSHEDVQAAIQSYSQAHPERAQKFRSVLVLDESVEADDLLDRTQEPLYFVYYAKGPLFYRGDPSSAPTWSSTKEEANVFPRAKAEEHLKFWRENYPQDAQLFQLIPEYSVRENQEADDLLGRIEDTGFVIAYTSVRGHTHYAQSRGRSIVWTEHRENATAYSYDEAQRHHDRIFDEQARHYPEARLEVLPAVHYVKENQDAKQVPDPLFTVSVHSINDRCTYYFNANGYMSRSPTSLNRSQVRRARKAAEKAYGSGQARVKPVNESKEDPFEGVGFSTDVQAFRRRGRKIRQTKRPIL